MFCGRPLFTTRLSKNYYPHPHSHNNPLDHRLHTHISLTWPWARTARSHRRSLGCPLGSSASSRKKEEELVCGCPPIQYTHALPCLPAVRLLLFCQLQAHPRAALVGNVAPRLSRVPRPVPLADVTAAASDHHRSTSPPQQEHSCVKRQHLEILCALRTRSGTTPRGHRHNNSSVKGLAAQAPHGLGGGEGQCCCGLTTCTAH